MVVGIALAAAWCYAAAMVLQHHSAVATDPEKSLRPGLLTDLARRPVWLAGVAANVAGFGLRFVALGAGSLVVVQPVLVSSLLFALPMSSYWHRERLHRREWTGACAIAAGLTLFIVVASPTRGHTTATATAWVATSAVMAIAAGAVVAFARRLRGEHRAAWLAVAGGGLLAFTAALSKVTASAARSEHLGVLASWPPYALIAITVIGAIVVQSAFGAARLPASLPVLMVVEPLASIALGVALFHEQVTGGALALVSEAVGLVAIAYGVFLIANSRVVVGAG